MRKPLVLLAALAALCVGAAAQGLPPSDSAYTGSPMPSGGAVSFTVTTSGANKIICMFETGYSCGTTPAGYEIFYTLDGSTVNEADTHYPCITSTTGCVTVFSQTNMTTVTVNALLVQMVCTSTSCMRDPTLTPVCSVANPCNGVIVQDGQNVKANLKTVVACVATQCPNTNFDVSTLLAMPTPINHGTSSSNLGNRGSPTQGTYQVGMSQPTVDLYGNTNTGTESTLSTAGAATAGGTTTTNGDTEDLIPRSTTGNVSPYNTTACFQCRYLAASRYVAMDYQGDTTNSLNAANLSHLEQDDNKWDFSLGPTTAACQGGGSACYIAGNLRYAPNSLLVTRGGQNYAGWQHCGQSNCWKSNWPNSFVPNEGLPWGTISALGTSGCTHTFTPGNSLYKSEVSWGLYPSSFELVDFGTANVETIYLNKNQAYNSTSVGSTNCVRGVGGTAHAHAAGARTVQFLKVQIHLTEGPASSTSCSASGGTASPWAAYYNYIILGGDYYGTPGYQSYLPSTARVLQTWGTQVVSGVTLPALCDYASTSTIYDPPVGSFNDQIQLYVQAGNAVNAMVGNLRGHDNVTADFGIVGNALSQLVVSFP